jgi:hypothetical protein
VVVEITRDGDGCILTLTQEGVPAADQKPLEEGWGKMFDGVAAALAA